MKITILDDNRVLINKNDTNYLIEHDYISGTMIKSYYIYEDIYNNLEHFIDPDNEDKYFYNECGDLIEAIKMIQEEE